MWKENLPENCPPNSAIEVEKELYRISHSNPMNENDFLPYVKLYPENQRYKDLCLAYALSFYDTSENAKIAYESAKTRDKILGRFIIRLKMKSEFGKCEENTSNGHHSVWFYETWSFNNFTALSVIEINDN